MAYAAIDTDGARALGGRLAAAADAVEQTRRQVLVALDRSGLDSDGPRQLALVGDGLGALSRGLLDKAERADDVVAPVAAPVAGDVARDDSGGGGAASSGIPVPAPSLRAVLSGLPAPGADRELDAALDRLDPVLAPALAAGTAVDVAAVDPADLRTLALALGLAAAGPRVAGAANPSAGTSEDGGLFARLAARRAPARTAGTEVSWNDFWADGRTVDEVLTDPARLGDWISGTYELDRRLGQAAELPGLADILATYDFAREGGDASLADLAAEADRDFAAISAWLPAHLAGIDRTPPDAAQATQVLAFATRVGWVDPDPEAGPDASLADALAYLRANRLLASALLPTGFAGDAEPLLFFNEAGIGLTLDLGRRRGVIDDAYLADAATAVDALAAGIGLDLHAATPAELTPQVQAALFALVGSQMPAALAQSAGIQAAFVAALGHLRLAGSGPDLRARIVDVLAGFRTVAVAGAPAFTERQLVSVVGDRVAGVLGRSRLRLRSEKAVSRNPEFFLVARQWGIPGGHNEKIGKYKFTWGFDDRGLLTGIRRKKRSWASRAVDTIKGIGKALVESWKDNPLKAIFEVGKIALGAAALIFPGTQALGIAALGVNLAGAAYHAIEGDWLAAVGSGLAAFTAGVGGAGGVLGGLTDTVSAAHAAVLTDLLDPVTLGFLTDARRAIEVASAVTSAIGADSVAGAVTAGLGAGASALGSGGALLGSLGVLGTESVGELARLGLSVKDLAGVVTPVAGLAAAVDGGSPLDAIGHGLGLVSAGAAVLGNPAGALGPAEGRGGLLGLEEGTGRELLALASTSGALGSVARAVAAADRGEVARTGALLVEAVDQLDGPERPGVDTARAATKIAQLGAVLEDAVEGRADPRTAAPAVVAGLTEVAEALTPRVAVPSPSTRRPAPEPASRPEADAAGAVPFGTALGAGLVAAPGVAAPVLPAPADQFPLVGPAPETVDDAEPVPAADPVAEAGSIGDLPFGAVLGAGLVAAPGVVAPVLPAPADRFPLLAPFPGTLDGPGPSPSVEPVTADAGAAGLGPLAGIPLLLVAQQAAAAGFVGPVEFDGAFAAPLFGGFDSLADVLGRDPLVSAAPADDEVPSLLLVPPVTAGPVEDVAPGPNGRSLESVAAIGARAGIGLVPVLNVLAGVVEAIDGEELLTGRPLTVGERIIGVIPFGGTVGKIVNVARILIDLEEQLTVDAGPPPATGEEGADGSGPSVGTVEMLAMAAGGGGTGPGGPLGVVAGIGQTAGLTSPPLRPTAGALVDPDPELARQALQYRVNEIGVEPDDFRRNVAVARVRVGDDIRYLTGVNTDRVLHSEDDIIGQVNQLRRTANQPVVVEQLYTERITCPHCAQKMRDLHPGASVFYSVELTAAEQRAFSGQRIDGRADALRAMYGVRPASQPAPRAPATRPPSARRR